MTIYFLIYSFISLKALTFSRYVSIISYLFILILLTLFIGLRFEIGVDWDQYINIVRSYEYLPLNSIFQSPEISYSFLSWLSAKYQSNIYIVNTICAFLFSTALLSYCNKQKYPWFSLVIAFPILVIVIAMGYTRQSCALALELFALLLAQEGKLNKAIILIILGSTFHKSILPLAAIFIPFDFRKLFKVKYLVPFIVIVSVGYFMLNDFFSGAFVNYLDNYILNTYSSKGSLYRIMPSLLAAILLLANKVRFDKLYGRENEIYFRFAYVVILLTLIMLLFPDNSTFADRIALFLTPLAMYVFPRLVELRYLNLSRIYLISLSIIVYQLYTFIWLSFAIHSYAWVPYKNILFFSSSSY